MSLEQRDGQPSAGERSGKRAAGDATADEATSGCALIPDARSRT